MTKSNYIHELLPKVTAVHKIQLVLFEFRAHLALHLGRSPLSNRYNYYFAGDRPICFASLTLIPESFMQDAG